MTSPGTGSTKPAVNANSIRNRVLAAPSPGAVQQVSYRNRDIHGELDLRHAKTECALVLEDCVFRSPVRLTEASMRSVSFRGSTIPEVEAPHVTVTGDLMLDKVRVAGRLRLAGAHLTDDLHLADARIGTPPDPQDVGQQAADDAGDGALDLENIDVRGMFKADHLVVFGTVNTREATIGGPVQLTNMHIHAGPGGATEPRRHRVSWSADGMKTGGILDASRLKADGQVHLIDANILGLVMTSVHVANAGYALMIDRLDSQGSIYLNERSFFGGGIHAIGIQRVASIYLQSCQLRASGKAEDTCRALDLRRARIGGDLWCNEGVDAAGTIDLTGSTVTGRVLLAGARLRGPNGASRTTAFRADDAQIGRELHADEGFRLRGTMSLVNARIGGSVRVRQGEATKTLALSMCGLRAGRDVDLDLTGTVDLSGAVIDGGLTLALERMKSGPGTAAAADLTDMNTAVLTLRGRPRRGFLDLTRASVGRLADNPADWPDDGKIVLDGLEYSAIAANDQARRLSWVRTGTRWVRSAATGYAEPGFTPQPFQQLAAVYQRTGDDRDARDVLHAMYCQRNKVKVKFREQPLIKCWNTAQNIFVGYGYKTWRAVAWLVGLTIGTTWWFAHYGHSGRGVIESAILSLGLALPGSGFGNIGACPGSCPSCSSTPPATTTPELPPHPRP